MLESITPERIENELEEIAMAVDTLQLWTEKMRANGANGYSQSS